MRACVPSARCRLWDTCCTNDWAFPLLPEAACARVLRKYWVNVTDTTQSVLVPDAGEGPRVSVSEDDQHCCFLFLFAVLCKELSYVSRP